MKQYPYITLGPTLHGVMTATLELSEKEAIVLPFDVKHVALVNRLAAAVNAFPQLMQQLEITSQQLKLHATPEDRGSLAVARAASDLLYNLKHFTHEQ